MIRKSLLLAAAAGASFHVPAIAQDEGPDLSIDAIEPTDEAITIGRAGEYPADIARFLLASGADQAKLSPDGKTIAFTSAVSGELELWVMPASGGQPKQITFKTGVIGADWTPDGKHLFYSADGDGDENPGFYIISADGRDGSEILPPRSGVFRNFGDFARDGNYLYASNARAGDVFDLYIGRLDGSRELLLEAETEYEPQSISPDGRYALFTSIVGEDANNLYMIDLETREVTTISEPLEEGRASHSLGGFQWWPDSSAFYFSSSADREFGTLSYYNLERGAFERIFETDAEVENLALCGAGNGGSYLFFTQNRDGFDDLRGWHTVEKRALTTPELPEGQYELDCQGDEAKLLVRIDGWKTPGDIWMVDPASGATKQIFESNLAGLDPDRLVRPQSVRYTARDGVVVQGMLYLPENASTGDDAPPVVMSVHGGPLGQSGPDYQPVAQYYVGRGIAYFAPNVRGSSGFGRSYQKLDDKRKRQDSVRDLVDLLEGLGNDGLVDTSRAIVSGGSYGGYVVNSVLSEYPGVFRAGVSLFSVADWVTALEDTSPSIRLSDKIEYGNIDDPQWREFYSEISPIRRADNITVPVLFSHGVLDPRINISETETMVKALRANGIEAPFIRIPDEGHGWRKLSNKLFYYRREADFVEKQFGMSEDE